MFARPLSRTVHIASFPATLILLVTPSLAREGERVLESSDLEGLSWRSIGPANMGGRVAALAFDSSDPHTCYVGYATSGLWKTTNNGTTFAPVFDEYETSSIGAVTVADAPESWPGWADADLDDDADRAEAGRGRIVWVGTGESNGRNSSSWGHGVYRSTDAGGSFEHLGLAETHDIPALVVDPDDPDVCFVAAQGHLWGRNPERGVYKTTDGGSTWRVVLQIDDETGACDVVMDPTDRSRLYAAMYRRLRTPWSFVGGSDEGGIFRSTDAGETWTKLTEGLPTHTGRIGLSIARSDPGIVYAIVESDDGGWVGGPFTNRQRGGGLFRSPDGGDTWTRMTDFNPRSFYFSKVRVDPKDPDRIYLLGWSLAISDDGGRTFRSGSAKVVHVDFHAMIVDPDDTDHLTIGTDGGLYVSWDRGEKWDFLNHMAVGQFYNVAVDRRTPYRVGGGLQDNGSWIGPSFSRFVSEGEWMGRAGAISNHDWTFVNGGDGFHLAFDPDDADIVYAESQGGWLSRVHLDTGVRRMLRPSAKEGEGRFRFNWNAPFLLSSHDPTTLYLGGNFVFRLTDRGDRWERISEDLSTGDIEKVIAVGSEAETAGTVVALAESPMAAGTLWAGTDDGRIHVTVTDGASWNDVTPAEVEGNYVSKIEASAHDARTSYAAIDGHRRDVFKPLLLVTRDLGRTWRSIASDLPDGGPVKVVREDPTNRDVLYVGTERAAYVTIDGGGHWVKLNGKSLPTVAVDDLALQVDRHDLVAGTHGRSIWILDDVTPLIQLTPEIVDEPLHAFTPRDARPEYLLEKEGLWSDRMFLGPNPPKGATLNYWIRDLNDEEVTITINAPETLGGHLVRKLTGTHRRGINRVVWDLLPEKAQRLENDDGLPDFVPAGTYTVSISHGEHTGTFDLEVLAVPE